MHRWRHQVDQPLHHFLTALRLRDLSLERTCVDIDCRIAQVIGLPAVISGVRFKRAQQTLARQAQWLMQYPTYAITVEGHADERGTREYNIALGARRAAATRDYLTARGVAANRMKTISYGKERPVAVCDDISCWSQNRRAVTTLSGAGS